MYQRLVKVALSKYALLEVQEQIPLLKSTFNISFTERDRPGRGGDANDFTLSSDTIAFADGETESCITVTAESDKHFDWITELRFDLTDPSSGEGLARNQFLVRIYNDNSATNTSQWHTW